MHVIETEIPEVKLIETVRHSDSRGFFVESFIESWFLENIAPVTFVQDNFSFSVRNNTLRGLHYQEKPFEQDKLVSVISGSIMDVAVDLRLKSTFFGKYVSRLLNSNDGKQLFIPKGFAHGYLTLEKNTAVSYKVSNYYKAESERGIIWNDSEIGIDWKISSPILSDKDSSYPCLADIKT